MDNVHGHAEANNYRERHLLSFPSTDKKDRKYAGFTLPAKGLTLESIEFE